MNISMHTRGEETLFITRYVSQQSNMRLCCGLMSHMCVKCIIHKYEQFGKTSLFMFAWCGMDIDYPNSNGLQKFGWRLAL